MSKLATAIRNRADASTFNGAATFSTSKNPIVDLFFAIGGANLNATPISSYITMFEEAYAFDSNRAIRVLLWLRDIRGGAGRREIFRQLMRHLEATRANVARQIVPFVSEYGRWDDLLIFETNLLKTAAHVEIAQGLTNPKVSGLVAKWMPRKGRQAAELRAFLQLTPKQYRKMLVKLTNVVESSMCAKLWNDIDYNHVPSLASTRYAKAFNKHDAVRYQEWRSALSAGVDKEGKEVKVNVGAIYPHDVIRSLETGDANLANEMWKALPDYIGNESIMAIVDVSGSMSRRIQGKVEAIDVSVSLGMYCAYKNRGPFKNLFMTFSGRPEFVELEGHHLAADYSKTITSNWDMNTDLQKAFELLLTTAKKNSAASSDMPKSLLIISDMEFDSCVHNVTNYQAMEAEFANAGYRIPNVIFWNVCGRPGNNPVRANQQGVALISGFSPALLTSVFKSESFTPSAIVDAVIMAPRYDIGLD